MTVVCLSAFLSAGLWAQNTGQGIITGTIIEKTTDKPLEFANVMLKGITDTTLVMGAITNKNGEFRFEKLSLGEYKLNYSFIGFDKIEVAVPALTAASSKINLGRMFISETGQTLGEVEVTARKSTFVNSIDRKTFNVGSDLMSKSGSVSELMQNIPSIQVDMDGNVSLRGSENVTILVDGKPSVMMDLNRAAVLQQMPASSIDKIEIITNPSAKYKPDGTSGIINIVLKKNRSLGFNGNINANAGNENRYNMNVLANYNPGKFNLFGSYGFRQDDRIRFIEMNVNTFSSSQLLNHSRTYSVGTARPVSNIANAGIDYKLNSNNKISVSGDYNYRFQRQKDVSTYTMQDNTSYTVLDYDRARILPEGESDLELTSSFQHTFNREGHELNVNFISSVSHENEDNYYTNTYRIPASAVFYDNMFYRHLNKESELAVEYSLPIAEDRKFETGYLLTFINNDLDLLRDTLDTQTEVWNKDQERSNHFIRSEYTHVAYATYEQEVGKFGFLAGLRAEQTYTTANLVSRDSLIKSSYTRFYPTLHLSYKLTNTQELQLNYSHRIRRPEDEELNPFPEYQDMRNVRAGNPNLKPEDIHSLELGYQIKKNATTFLSTLYYRYSYNGITSIITNLGNNVLLSTLQNLSKNRSSGVELLLSTSIQKIITINLGTNTFFNAIDASDLGYSSKKSTVAWSTNANISFTLSKSSVLQVTSNYQAKRLTPQGYQQPTFVLNAGFKQEFLKKRATFMLTISDVFNTMRNVTIIDTPVLYEKMIRKRSPRIIYAGFSYAFGKSQKAKENGLKYDNQL